MPDKKKSKEKLTNEEIAKKVFHPKILIELKKTVNYEQASKRKSRST